MLADSDAVVIGRITTPLDAGADSEVFVAVLVCSLPTETTVASETLDGNAAEQVATGFKLSLFCCSVVVISPRLMALLFEFAALGSSVAGTSPTFNAAFSVPVDA